MVNLIHDLHVGLHHVGPTRDAALLVKSAKMSQAGNREEILVSS